MVVHEKHLQENPLAFSCLLEEKDYDGAIMNEAEKTQMSCHVSLTFIQFSAQFILKPKENGHKSLMVLFRHSICFSLIFSIIRPYILNLKSNLGLRWDFRVLSGLPSAVTI